MKDTYFDRPEVSNSDLGWLEEYFMPANEYGDREAAYRFGTLVDAIVTEPERVDYFKRTVDNEVYSREDFDKAGMMKKALRQNEIWQNLAKLSTFQQVFTGDVNFKVGRVEFTLPMRCKYDFFIDSLGWGGDLKSTFATSQKQFIEACEHFDYDRSRVLYMLLSGAKQDILVGVSKQNYKVFTFTIRQGDPFYMRGLEKLETLAFRWWCLFDGLTF